MTQIVVPFRGRSGKQRLEASDDARARLSLAMLGDVLAAATAVGRTLVVTGDVDGQALAEELGAEVVFEPGGGQGAAVGAALGLVDGGTALVINADVPCVVPHDLRTLAGAAELGALAYVEAEDATTNALGLPEPAHFAPLYGGGSAARFRDHAEELGLTAISCAIPNLSDDVDTMDDLRRIGLRAGPRTLAALGTVLQP